ncbi:unknown [Clostridium sp. CAG:768]|nr:unknown [Clostridium sp. CAG:768]
MDKIGLYQIKQKDFEKLEKLAENIYNMLVVIDYFL